MDESARTQLVALAVALLLVKEIPSYFSDGMSSRFTIASFVDGSEKKADLAKKWIRAGELEGGVQSIFLGIGGSILLKSPWPFLLALAVIGWKVWSTETGLRDGTHFGFKEE